MLPFSPRLRIALATAEAVAKGEGRQAATCADIAAGIASLSGGVADNLLRARGFSASVAAVPLTTLSHDPTAYSVDSLRALSRAIVEAADRSHELVGVEDLLIGLLSPPSEQISALFARRGLNLEELLSEVRRQM